MADPLDDIRRAAFELRQTDPQEAVRVLRRAAAAGGDAEVLARGALGEIYLEEFGDLDGAEHEFRAVLKAAPGLPAAELGLARVLREQGDDSAADQGLEKALQGLARDVAGFRASAGPLPPGIEEVVLTLLEVAVELAELRSAHGHDNRVEVGLDESLLGWAEEERLLDATEDQDDWVRFYSLWTQLRILTGRAAEAAVALAKAALQPKDRARLRSLAFEEAGDTALAGEEARQMLAATPPPWSVGDTVRAAHLAGDPGLLKEALGQERPAEEADALREALGLPVLVVLGRK